MSLRLEKNLSQNLSTTSMLSTEISDGEKLFRAIKKIPDWWNFETNKPTSAVFKDKNGVSVDRQGGRTEEQATNYLKRKLSPLRAVINIVTKKCRETGTFPIYCPSKKDKFHSEIHGSPNNKYISPSKARSLALASEISYFDKI